MTDMSVDWAAAGIKAAAQVDLKGLMHLASFKDVIIGPAPEITPKDTHPVECVGRAPLHPIDGNPKTIYGQAKPSPSVVPPGAILECAIAMQEGTQKYGRANWRDDPVSYSTYFDAMMRHLLQAWDGEDRCPKSGALHMAHAMANAAIILDARACGTLIDDRPTKGASSKLITEYTKEIAPNG